MTEESKKIYTVYIDESGDMGIERGSRWFVLSGVIVEQNEEKEIRSTLTTFQNRYNYKMIHWTKIQDFYERAELINALSNCTFSVVSIILDTANGNKIALKDSNLLYNYMCRYLLERVSWYLSDNNGQGRIVLSSRGTSQDQELVEYIKKLFNHSKSRIENVFIDVNTKQAAAWQMLQLADVCASATFNAHEHYRGFTTPCHLSKLKNHLYRSNSGRLYNYGMKYYSHDMKPNKSYWHNTRICNK